MRGDDTLRLVVPCGAGELGGRPYLDKCGVLAFVQRREGLSSPEVDVDRFG